MAFTDPRDIACTTKRRYPSKAQAKKHLKKLEGWGRRGLVIYECRFCGEFHLGYPPGQQTYRRAGRPFG